MVHSDEDDDPYYPETERRLLCVTRAGREVYVPSRIVFEPDYDSADGSGSSIVSDSEPESTDEEGDGNDSVVTADSDNSEDPNADYVPPPDEEETEDEETEDEEEGEEEVETPPKKQKTTSDGPVAPITVDNPVVPITVDNPDPETPSLVVLPTVPVSGTGTDTSSPVATATEPVEELHHDHNGDNHAENLE
jgi:hypothetical protein